jgi:dienelactone hydrolase
MRGWIGVGMFAWIAAGCTPALKDLKPGLAASNAGTIWFASAGTLVRSADGNRFVPGEPIPLSGELHLPAGAGPFPAVILAHGCGGRGNADAGWAIALREWGYATFVVDSFRGRGLTQVCTSQGSLTPTQRLPDVYGALRSLATHPRVDKRRIALMGFSHGADVAMRAATQWAKDTYAPPGQPGFRAIFPFYGYCSVIYPERNKISVPLRFHHGELDDWLPPGSCVQYVASLKASGQDASITLYPGARHSFDNASIGAAYVHLPSVDSVVGCTIESTYILGPLKDPSRFQAMMTRCIRKGASVGFNPEATELARRNVRAQLSALMK